jgi:hypothetical protein
MGPVMNQRRATPIQKSNRRDKNSNLHVRAELRRGLFSMDGQRLVRLLDSPCFGSCPIEIPVADQLDAATPNHFRDSRTGECPRERASCQCALPPLKEPPLPL